MWYSFSYYCTDSSFSRVIHPNLLYFYINKWRHWGWAEHFLCCVCYAYFFSHTSNSRRESKKKRNESETGLTQSGKVGWVISRERERLNSIFNGKLNIKCSRGQRPQHYETYTNIIEREYYIASYKRRMMITKFCQNPLTLHISFLLCTHPLDSYVHYIHIIFRSWPEL